MEQLCEPNVYQIKPVNGVSPEQLVNYRQLQDLKKAHDDGDNTSDKDIGNKPSFNPKVRLKEAPHTNTYATKQKGDLPH